MGVFAGVQGTRRTPGPLLNHFVPGAFVCGGLVFEDFVFWR